MSDHRMMQLRQRRSAYATIDMHEAVFLRSDQHFDHFALFDTRKPYDEQFVCTAELSQRYIGTFHNYDQALIAAVRGTLDAHRSRLAAEAEMDALFGDEIRPVRMAWPHK